MRGGDDDSKRGGVGPSLFNQCTQNYCIIVFLTVNKYRNSRGEYPINTEKYYWNAKIYNKRTEEVATILLLHIFSLLHREIDITKLI